MRIYLDACCFSRLTDDQSQSRVRGEAEAVEAILRTVREGRATWVASPILNVEVNRNPDEDQRRETEELLSFADEIAIPDGAAADRARHLEKFGFSPFDALHLACAEQGGADVLLTTDDRFLRCADRSHGLLRIRVENPVSWYKEAQL